LDVCVCLVFQVQIHKVVDSASGLGTKGAAEKDVVCRLLLQKLVSFDVGVGDVCTLALAINHKLY
jgi:hypothetical protein